MDITTVAMWILATIGVAIALPYLILAFWMLASKDFRKYVDARALHEMNERRRLG